jgi:hypothetical protein
LKRTFGLGADRFLMQKCASEWLKWSRRCKRRRLRNCL